LGQIPAARGYHRMNALHTLPPWAALLVGVLALAGAGLAFIGCLGLLRLQHFYQRMHAPTLGTTLGLYLLVAATTVFFAFLDGYGALRILLVASSIVVTAPITFLLLVRAARTRDAIAAAPPRR